MAYRINKKYEKCKKSGNVNHIWCTVVSTKKSHINQCNEKTGKGRESILEKRCHWVVSVFTLRVKVEEVKGEFLCSLRMFWKCQASLFTLGCICKKIAELFILCNYTCFLFLSFLFLFP